MKRIVYVDMDNVLVDFVSAIPHLADAVVSHYRDRLDDVPGIFALMNPMPGAIEAYAELCQRFDTYILSTAPWGNPSAWSDKLLWVQAHLGDGAHKRLILTHHKNLNMGDFLIDDQTNNGSDGFGGEHVHFGSGRYPDWPSVMEYMRCVAAEA